MAIFSAFKKEKKPPLPLPPARFQEEKMTLPTEFPEIRFDKTQPLQLPVLENQESSSTNNSDNEMEEEQTIEPIKGPTEEKKEIPFVNIENIKEAFIASDEYQIIIENLESIRSKLNEAEDHMKFLVESKEVQEKELEKWRQRLDGVEKKLLYIDKLIEGAEL